MITTRCHHLSTRFGETDAKVEIGVDEAGRGCFWGPLMAGAVVWPPIAEWTNDHWAIAGDIKDSKKIAEKKRRKIATEIRRLASGWGVGIVTAAEIDEHGITWANKQAFRRALAAVSESVGWERVVIDGTISIEPPREGIEVMTVVDGDATYLHVAAASILAKVGHDDWVEEYCKQDTVCAERYSLLTSHGYGTAKHREGLRANGAHEHHRRTFIHRWVSDPGLVRDEKCLIRLSTVSAGTT